MILCLFVCWYRTITSHYYRLGSGSGNSNSIGVATIHITANDSAIAVDDNADPALLSAAITYTVPYILHTVRTVSVCHY